MKHRTVRFPIARALVVVGLAVFTSVSVALVLPSAAHASNSATWTAASGTGALEELDSIACADATHCVASGPTATGEDSLVGSGSSWADEPYPAEVGRVQING